MRVISLCAVLFCCLPLSGVADGIDSSRITDEILPFQTDIPERPSPILELGDTYFGRGPIWSGVTLPTGMTVQPSLLLWGTYRTAVQTIDDAGKEVSEWANRFDLFGNLYLSRTERVLVGMRPLDKNGQFTRYTFDASGDDGREEGHFEDAFNANVTTLFFEGDLGEMLPALDEKDKYGLDVAIAVGRQPLSFQDGMLINDSVDSLGFSKINLKPAWAVNWRSAAIWGWDELNRNNLMQEDGNSSLFGSFNEIDFRDTTLETDFVYVHSDEVTGSGYFGGLGATQRFGIVNSTFRILGSIADGAETESTRDGVLFFSELSYAPKGTDDHLYLNGFWALDQYRSASRAPAVGGPLGPTGILFAAVALGRYGAALDNNADDAFGGALGYQLFANESRTQLVFELGGRYGTEEIGQRAMAAGVQVQQALGRRVVVRCDLFGKFGDERFEIDDSTGNDYGYGARLEWVLLL